MTTDELDSLARSVSEYLVADPLFEKLILSALDDYFFKTADQNLRHYLQTHRDYLASVGIQVGEVTPEASLRPQIADSLAGNRKPHGDKDRGIFEPKTPYRAGDFI